MVGAREGCLVVGEAEGLRLGEPLGAMVNLVGAREGLDEGELVGERVGEPVVATHMHKMGFRFAHAVFELASHVVLDEVATSPNPAVAHSPQLVLVRVPPVDVQPDHRMEAVVTPEACKVRSSGVPVTKLVQLAATCMPV